MKKRAADVNQLGKLIVGLATGEETEDLEPSKRQIAGRASAAKLTLQDPRAANGLGRPQHRVGHLRECNSSSARASLAPRHLPKWCNGPERRPSIFSQRCHIAVVPRWYG